MNKQFIKSSSIMLVLVLLMGCATVVHVTSNPPGARVYNASGTSQCGPAELGYQPYDHVQGRYRGNTPVLYTNLYWYDNVRVVWPDGEDSGWQQQPLRFGPESVFHFTKSNSGAAPAAAPINAKPSLGQAIDTIPEKLAVLKTLWESGDLSKEEYLQLRATILDALTRVHVQNTGTPRHVNREADRASEAQQLSRLTGREAEGVHKAQIALSVHVEDDPASGLAIVGNGDGLIQAGEAFNLVVVVANTSTSALKDVVCTVGLPAYKAINAYSDLHFAVSELEPAAAATNRINMNMPAKGTISTAPTCIIEVKEDGHSIIERLNYKFPMGLE